MYKDYLSEEDGLKVLESSHGFCAYKLRGEECLIAQLYVIPESRKQGKARDLVDAVVSLVKNAGCKYISANIFQDFTGCKSEEEVMSMMKKNTEKLRIFIKYGFLVTRILPSQIILTKEI